MRVEVQALPAGGRGSYKLRKHFLRVTGALMDAHEKSHPGLMAAALDQAEEMLRPRMRLPDGVTFDDWLEETNMEQIIALLRELAPANVDPTKGSPSSEPSPVAVPVLNGSHY